MSRDSIRLLNVAKYATYAFGLGLILVDKIPGVTPITMDPGTRMALLVMALTTLAVVGVGVLSWYRPQLAGNSPFLVPAYVLEGLAIFGVNQLNQNGWGILLYFVASAEAILDLPIRKALGIWGLFFILQAANITYRSGFDRLFMEAFGAFISFLFVLAMSYLARQQMEDRGRMAGLLADLRRANRELELAHRQLQEHTAQAEELAVVRERNRLAREIHDTLAHTLTALVILMEASGRLIGRNPDQAKEGLTKAKDLAREGLAEVRRSVSALRPMTLEVMSGSRAWRKLAEDFDRTIGMKVQLRIAGNERRLGEAVEIAIYRALQEALTNAHRHGHARNVDIVVNFLSATVEVTVKDDGKGADKPAKGFGLLGIRERVEALGGLTEVRTRPGDGFELRLSIPVPDVESNAPEQRSRVMLQINARDSMDPGV